MSALVFANMTASTTTTTTTTSNSSGKRKSSKQNNSAVKQSGALCHRNRRRRLHLSALLMVACSGCLVLLCQVNLSSAANGMIPPRGYCTQISRAIPKQSRCYNHLLQFHLGAAAAAAAAHRKRSSLNDSYENNAANWNKEELVYVRLETIGSKIEALNTVAINERLVFGTFKGLFGGSVTNNERIHTASSQQANDVVAQILGSNELNGDSRQALRCREAIERFLCRLIYPNCHFKHDASVLVRPTCREDCLVLRDVLCPNLDWPKFSLVLRRTFNETLKATINSLDLAVENQSKDYTNLAAIVSSSSNNEQHQQQQQQRLLEIPSDSNHFYWPHEHSIDRCESLPPLRFITKPIETPLDAQERPYESPTGQWSPRRNLRWPICSNAHLTRTLPANGGLNDRAQSKQADCLSTSEGAGYVGHKNQTKDGLWCQAWHSQWPHSHTSSELLFDTMREAHNYCRNPGGTELKPWCYTRDPNTRWQYCDIESC